MEAMAFADRGLSEIIIGTVASDDFHSDGTKDFLEAMSHVLSAQDENLKLSAPAARETTRELVVLSEISRDTLACLDNLLPSRGVCLWGSSWMSEDYLIIRRTLIAPRLHSDQGKRPSIRSVFSSTRSAAFFGSKLGQVAIRL